MEKSSLIESKEISESERIARIQALAEAMGEDEPVVMLNLLKFKPDGGEKRFNEYGKAFMRPVQLHAPETRILFLGACKALLIGDKEWDRIVLVQYPSIHSFIKLISSPEYLKIAPIRSEAISDSVLYAIAPKDAPDFGAD